MGAGMDNYPTANYRKDFWEYDPVTDIWTQKADFGGTARYTMVGCSAGGYGYAGTGKEHSATVLFNDFWRYDPNANIWTQLNNFPGVGRQACFVMTINDRIYAGMGRSSVAFLNDWYMYNDTADTWISLAPFPGTPRSAGFGFCINGKGYLGAGMVTYSPLYTTINDCWEYDPIMNLWAQVADFPGTARFNTIGFAVNNKGYAGVGSNVSGGISVYYSDFYEYDAGLNSWTQKANFPVQEIASGGFVINNRGYAGCGLMPSGVLSNYFWEYTPDSLTFITEASPESAITILPNPVTDALIISGPDLKKIDIFNIYGAVMYSGIFETNQREPRRIDVGFLPTGSYFLKTGDVMKKFVKL